MDMSLNSHHYFSLSLLIIKIANKIGDIEIITIIFINSFILFHNLLNLFIIKRIVITVVKNLAFYK